MNVAENVNELATQLREILAGPVALLEDPDRDPGDIGAQLDVVRRLIRGLPQTAQDKVPRGIFLQHVHHRQDLEANLTALQDDLRVLQAGNQQAARSRAERSPESIPAEVITNLFYADVSDIKMAEIFGCSTRTVARRRVQLRLERLAATRGTTDGEVAQVSPEPCHETKR